MVSTRAGEGTTLRTLLPTAPAADSAPPKSGPHKPESTAGGALVLVVEDEKPLREMSARMLERADFAVATAANLTEARSVLEDRAPPLVAVVLDVVLGAEYGPDLFADLQRARPGVRIVVTSAFTPERDVVETVEAHGALFLPKPYTYAGLVRAVGGAPETESKSTQ